MVHSMVVLLGRRFNKTSRMFTWRWMIFYPVSKHSPETVMVNRMEIYLLDCDIRL